MKGVGLENYDKREFPNFAGDSSGDSDTVYWCRVLFQTGAWGHILPTAHRGCCTLIFSYRSDREGLLPNEAAPI